RPLVRAACFFWNTESKSAQYIYIYRSKDLRGVLFITQGHHGVDAHRTSRGEIAREYRHRAQDYCDSDEGCRIGRGDPVEQGRKKVSCPECHAKADDQANYGKEQAVLDDEV